VVFGQHHLDPGLVALDPHAHVADQAAFVEPDLDLVQQRGQIIPRDLELLEDDLLAVQHPVRHIVPVRVQQAIAPPGTRPARRDLDDPGLRAGQRVVDQHDAIGLRRNRRVRRRRGLLRA